MKILLAACNAKYIHSNLAVYSLRASAGECRKDIVLKEYTINQQKDELLEDIYREQAQVLFFSCYIWNIGYIEDLACDLKKIMPDLVIWAGGPEVSYDAGDFLMKNPAFLGVLEGEGEATFRELAEYYLYQKGNLRDIKGLVFRDETGIDTSGIDKSGIDKSGINTRGINTRGIDGTGIYRSAGRERMDLSSVPFVYKDLSDFAHRIIYYESSRGCPFSCSYCLSSIDKKLRFRDMALVKKELQYFLDHKVPQVKFVDRTFNCRHEHAAEIWKFLLDHDNGVTNFHFEISADLLNEEELELMSWMRPGLIQLEIGVQSTNPRTLQAIRRNADLEKLKKTVAAVHSFGNIHQHLDLIAGLPYEDYESFVRSFNDVYDMKPQQLQLGFLKVLKGTHMQEMTQEYQIQYKEHEPYEVLSTKWLSYGDILKLKRVESMVEVYYNSGQFENTLSLVVPFFENAFTFYQKLGDYYARNGYSQISHSRMRRYEILLEFLEQEAQITVKGMQEAQTPMGGMRDTQIPVDKVQEAMLMDLYLRENLKSRPGFLPWRREWEPAVREYRKNHPVPKTAHIEVFSDGRALLFDYERRDPLTNNAYTKEIHIKR